MKTLDVAKRLLDYGFYAPTIYFPLVVKGALMIEPTETETKETLDAFVDAMLAHRRRGADEPGAGPRRAARHARGRLDETRAARRPVLRWRPPAPENCAALEQRRRKITSGSLTSATVTCVACARARDVGAAIPRSWSSTARTCRSTSRRSGARCRCSTRTSRGRWTSSTGPSTSRAGRTCAANEDSIGLVDQAIRVPRVILLLAYDRVPRRYVRFSRFNIYSRDQNRCQYCGRQFPRAELNLDHVVPRSKGGTSTWENVVCSCHRCNRLKGGRTPTEAGMRLHPPAAAGRSGRRS